MTIFAPKFIRKMATNRTFTMLKPDAIENGHMGKILDMIIQAGFQIKAMKYTRLTEQQAKKFYEVHAERPFYGELVEYMTSGPIVAASWSTMRCASSESVIPRRSEKLSPSRRCSRTVFEQSSRNKATRSRCAS